MGKYLNTKTVYPKYLSIIKYIISYIKKSRQSDEFRDNT